MDANELARIERTLTAAIAEAKAILQEIGADDQFAGIVRHAREMHDILLDALRAARSQATPRMWGLSTALGNAVDELEGRDVRDERRLV